METISNHCRNAAKIPPNVFFFPVLDKKIADFKIKTTSGSTFKAYPEKLIFYDFPENL